MMKQEADLDSEKQIYLTCEKYYIFELLIFAAGMMGAYTFNLRGGVFCNAQTANVVLVLAPLAISFFIMMHADRSFENSRLAIKPHGH